MRCSLVGLGSEQHTHAIEFAETIMRSVALTILRALTVVGLHQDNINCYLNGQYIDLGDASPIGSAKVGAYTFSQRAIFAERLTAKMCS